MYRGEYPVGRKANPGEKKGSGWVKELGLRRGSKAYAFQPNSVYKVGNSYYQTDVSRARVKYVRCYYENQKADRGSHQTRVGKLSRSSGDVGGHLKPSARGGSGHAINMTPMAYSINKPNGEWSIMERELASYADRGCLVYVKIELHYPDAVTLRASSFTVTAIIKGGGFVTRYIYRDHQIVNPLD